MPETDLSKNESGHSDRKEVPSPPLQQQQTPATMQAPVAATATTTAPTAQGGGVLSSDAAMAAFGRMGVNALTQSSASSSSQGGASMPPSVAPVAPPNPFLPTTAPVSSLLPPLPPTAPGLNPLVAANLQAQLMALLNPSALASSAAALSLAAAAQVQQQQTQPQATPSLGFADASSTAGSTQLVTSAVPTGNMQNWSLEQLEKRVALLQQLKQPVPQNVAMLLQEAKRREDKRQAKRVANRRSACTSRARKKALVQQMTEINARLKRQALILALLPDLVIVTDVNGTITFCSAQVERVLHYKIDDLIGAPITELLVPSSRDKMRKLVKQLVKTSTSSTGTKVVDGQQANDEEKKKDLEEEDELEEEDASGEKAEQESQVIMMNEEEPAVESTAAALVSDQSFPMSVVKVQGGNLNSNNAVAAGTASDEQEVSDTSASNAVGSKEPSSLTNSASVARSPTASPLENSGSDDNAKKEDSSNNNSNKATTAKKGLSSDDNSNTSSLSTDAKKLQKANQNLERNVRIHNRKLKDMSFLRAGLKDDVIGADVTANNASARLSSLRHRGAGGGESEEDSGYRESNDSREETSSSASDTSASNARRQPMAPACNVCLIRNDLTSVWFEVTSSIRTQDPNEDADDLLSEDLKPKKSPPGGASVSGKETIDTTTAKTSVNGEEYKEILLCLRPIRDGDGKVDPKHRFVSRRKLDGDHEVSAEENTSADPVTTSSGDTMSNGPSGPPKKRIKVHHAAGGSRKRKQVDTEAVESLMLMSNHKKQA